MNTLRTWLSKVHDEFAAEDGAAMVEYGLLLFFIALAVIVALTAVGEDISAMFTDISNRIPAPQATPST